MRRSALRSVPDGREDRRSRRETYVLTFVVLIVWATVALACMGTRGFTRTTNVRPDPSAAARVETR